MSKQKLFLDFDGTISDSIKAFCDTYNEIYQFYPNYKRAIWYEVEEWNFSDQCPLIKNCNDIFSQYLFFKKCQFINDNTKEVIEKLCEKYQVIVVSIGTPENISHKSIWLRDNLSCIKDYALLVNNGCKMNKSIINMKDGIFIDDVTDNLDSSNADCKIIFGDIYKWSRTKDYLRCFNWTDIERLLI